MHLAAEGKEKREDRKKEKRERNRKKGVHEFLDFIGKSWRLNFSS